MDGTFKTLSVTNKTTVESIINTILNKVAGIKLEEFKLIIVSRTQPEGDIPPFLEILLRL